MLLVGIIPGPKEPSLTINSYLTPLVYELKEFYQGVVVPSISSHGNYTTSVVIRLALICIVCDLPATRKVCGFVSFNGYYGCSRCFKSFPTLSFGEGANYSGYDKENWPKRDLIVHKQKSYEHRNSKTKADQKHIEKSFGIRYSVLIELPYFNPIKHAVIDPMHNLFLGTAKYCMQYWIKKGILSKQHMEIIEDRVSSIIAPHNIGRLPNKISSGFAGFSADQWRNWTMCYSSIALRNVLPRQHLQYWLLFVKACTLLCTRCLHKSNVDLADRYLNMFRCKFEEVNGSEACTPNMHLHLHLKECLYDYGPLYAFWCYAFERYNGMLGNFPTNQKNIEPQLMKRCLLLQEMHSQTFPVNDELFSSILQQSHSASGGLLLTMLSGESILSRLKLFAPIFQAGLNFTASSYERCLAPIKQIVLDAHLTNILQELYAQLYPNMQLTQISQFAKKSLRVSIGETLFGSKATSRDNNIVICAYWPTSGSRILFGQAMPLSIGQVQYYIKHNLSTTGNNETYEHIFAYINWYKKHENHDWFGSNAIVCEPVFEVECAFSFLPVQRISSVCAYGKLDLQFTNSIQETVVIASPVLSNNYNQ